MEHAKEQGAPGSRQEAAETDIAPATADIMDVFDGDVQVVPNSFRDYGGVSRFCGQVETVKCFENNPLVRQRLTTEDGTGKVLVVDGGGSLRRALMGDQLAAGAVEMGWRGVIINGAVRDSVAIGKLSFGCKALGTMPRKSEKKVPGEQNVPVEFAGLQFRPGQFVYADEDGIVVSDQALKMPPSGKHGGSGGAGAGARRTSHDELLPTKESAWGWTRALPLGAARPTKE